MGARPVSLCVNSFPDLRAELSFVSDAYSNAADGGCPGSAAARQYRADRDRIFGEAARRTAGILSLLITGVPS